jgi:hypothetical protein
MPLLPNDVAVALVVHFNQNVLTLAAVAMLIRTISAMMC